MTQAEYSDIYDKINILKDKYKENDELYQELDEIELICYNFLSGESNE